MAKMIGKLQVRDWCGYGCCTSEKSKHTVKIEEMAQVLKDVDDELFWWEDKAHERGMCYDPVTKSYGCRFCEDLDDAYDNSDLDEIEGVWCNVDWRHNWQW